ncbi:phosphatase 2C-like domain-containing protein [Bombardia bombarda]|uniref:Protein phosphatase n=1 Tax=Bombardia bombarda TaxID=252184 RepID=A0AA39X6Z2_9PEZI|nr:phosphatase 2C-like domain-containing protein [Bombardia bombarda]
MRRLAPRLPAPTRRLASYLRGTAASVSTSSAAGSGGGSPVLRLHQGLRRRLLLLPAEWQKQLTLSRQQRASFLTALTPLLLDSNTSSCLTSLSSAKKDITTPPTGDDGSDGQTKSITTSSTTAWAGAVPSSLPKLPFRFETGIALFAKRAPRPFPPPFLSPPSGSFSDPLSTHNRSRDRRAAYVDGHMIQGLTNGDDAVFASEYFICANDGVGAWSTRPRGHAGLWARLILHFWATAIFEDAARQGDAYKPDPVAYLQRAYEQAVEATSAPNDWQGTTTAAGALLHYRPRGQEVAAQDSESSGSSEGDVEPLLYVTNIGDSQVMVVRPSTRELVFKSTEQWHWFDCPRQLGTNSPDTPENSAVVDAVPIREGDIVLAMSDGVIDNLWAHEIVEKVSESMARWQAGDVNRLGVMQDPGDGESGMAFVAGELMEAAREIAVDPFAESPFMEHAIEEGLASEGGKMDDISVVAGLCRKNE